MAIGIFFKEQCTNWQPEKNTQVKRTNALFFCYSSSDIVCHSIQDTRKRYRKQSINTTSIITVKLFVTTSQLEWGQTSVIMVKMGALMVKKFPRW